MSRFERILLVFMVIIAVVLWVAVGFNLVKAWQAPLGPSLAMPTFTPLPQPDFTQAVQRPTAGPTSTMIPGHPTLTPFVANVVPQTLCGGPATMTVLAIGSDTRSPNYLYGLADVIRLVRVDFRAPSVTVLEFPRDLWVEIPDISEHYGITHGKLNQSYLYGNKGMGYYKGPGEGPGLLARTLDLNFGARPDHYVAANMHTFTRLVNVLGGVDVNLPHSVDGRKADQSSRADLYFKAGHHHLNGQEALMLARLRPQGVFERANQQSLVLCAVRDALIKPSNLPKLPEIIKTFDGAVQTDLSPQQIGQLACLMPSLNPRNITFISFPTDLMKGARTYDIGVQKEVFIWDTDFNILRTYVSAFYAGTWPAAAPIAAGGQSDSAPAATPEPPFTCP